MEEQAAEQKDASKDLKDRIIDYFNAHGGNDRNIAIMRALKVGDELYWRERDRLSGEGRVGLYLKFLILKKRAHREAKDRPKLI